MRRFVVPLKRTPVGIKPLACCEEIDVDFIPVSDAENNCLEKNVDGLFVNCNDGGGGPPGPAGPAGPAGADGQIRYTGIGPPPIVIVGASPGDTYLDLLSGDIYKLT